MRGDGWRREKGWRGSKMVVDDYLNKCFVPVVRPLLIDWRSTPESLLIDSFSASLLL